MLNGWVVETRVHFGDDLCHYVGVSVFFRKVSVTFLGRTPVLIVFVGVGSLLAYRLGLRLLQSHVSVCEHDQDSEEDDLNIPTTSRTCGIVCCKCGQNSSTCSVNDLKLLDVDNESRSVDTELTDIVYQSSPCHVRGSRIKANLQQCWSQQRRIEQSKDRNKHPLYDQDSPYLLSLDQLNSLESPTKSRSKSSSIRLSASPGRPRACPRRHLFNDTDCSNAIRHRSDGDDVLIVTTCDADTASQHSNDDGDSNSFAMDSPPPIRRKFISKGDLNGTNLIIDDDQEEYSEASSRPDHTPPSFQWDQVCTPQHELGEQFDVPADCANPVAYLIESIRKHYPHPDSSSGDALFSDASEQNPTYRSDSFPTSAIFRRVNRPSCEEGYTRRSHSDGVNCDSYIDPSVIRHRFSTPNLGGHNADGVHLSEMCGATRGLLDLLSDLPELNESAVLDDGDEYFEENSVRDLSINDTSQRQQKERNGKFYGSDCALIQHRTEEENSSSSIIGAIDADMNLGDSTQLKIDNIFGDINALKMDVKAFQSDVAMRTSQVFASDMTKLYCSVPPMAPSTVNGGLDDRSSIVSGGQMDESGSEVSDGCHNRSCRSSSDRFWNMVRRRPSWRKPLTMGRRSAASDASYKMSRSMCDYHGEIRLSGSVTPEPSVRRTHSCSCSDLDATIRLSNPLNPLLNIDRANVIDRHSSDSIHGNGVLKFACNRPIRITKSLSPKLTADLTPSAGVPSSSDFVFSGHGNTEGCHHPQLCDNNGIISHNYRTNRVGSVSLSSLNIPSSGTAPAESSSSSNGGERADYFSDSLHNISISDKLLAGRRPPLMLPLGATGSYANALNDSYHTQISLDLAPSQRSDESLFLGGRMLSVSQDVTPLSGGSSVCRRKLAGGSHSGGNNSSAGMQRSFLTDSFISTDYTPSDGNFDPSAHDNFSFQPVCCADRPGDVPKTSAISAMTCAPHSTVDTLASDSVPIWSSTPASSLPNSACPPNDANYDKTTQSTGRWNQMLPGLAATLFSSPAKSSVGLLNPRDSRSQSCAGDTSSDAWQWDDFDVEVGGPRAQPSFDGGANMEDFVEFPAHLLQHELDAVLPESLRSSQWLSQNEHEQCLEAIRVRDWANQRFVGNKRIARILRILETKHGYSLVLLPPTGRVVDSFAANFIQPSFELVAGRPFSVLKSVVLAAVAQSVPVFRCQSFGIVQEALELSIMTKRHGYLTAWKFAEGLVDAQKHRPDARPNDPAGVVRTMTTCLQKFWQLTSLHHSDGSLSSSALIDFYHGCTGLEQQVLEGAKILMLLRAVDVYEHICASREAPLAFYHALFQRYRLPELMADLACWERQTVLSQEANELLIALLADTIGVRIDCFPFHLIKSSNVGPVAQDCAGGTTSESSEPLVAVVYPQKAAVLRRCSDATDNSPGAEIPRLVLLQTGIADYLPLLKADQRMDSSV